MRHVACAMFVWDGRILLGRRSSNRPTYPDCWDVLGGHVEDGESVDDALRREALEEVGVMPTAFRRVAILDEPSPARNGAKAYHMFVVTEWTGGEPSMRGDEHIALRWFPFDEARRLPDLALHAYRDLFARLALAKVDA